MRRGGWWRVACWVVGTWLWLWTAVHGQRAALGEEGEALAAVLRSFNRGDPRPPIVLIPGIVGSRMVAWKKKKCIGPSIEVQDIVWLNLQKLVETMTYDKHCWLDCMKLGKNGTDPVDCKIRPDEGLGAIGELSAGSIITPPATSIFTRLVRSLAHDLGYDSNNIIGAPYDWRLAPSELEERDSYFSSLKFKIESAVRRSGRPAIVMAHSMGNNLFLYFCDWLRVVDHPAMGWERWLHRHIWAHVGFAAPLLGSPSAIKSVMSGHAFGLPLSDRQAHDLLLTFPVTHFLNPRPSSHWDYPDPVMTIRSRSGGKSMSFSVEDVASGDIFRAVGLLFKDSLLAEKLDVLKTLYLADPVGPLAPPRRPPVRHVLMIYGVDLLTEVGYVYNWPEQAPGLGSESLGPELDEVLEEAPAALKDDKAGLLHQAMNLFAKQAKQPRSKEAVSGPPEEDEEVHASEGVHVPSRGLRLEALSPPPPSLGDRDVEIEGGAAAADAAEDQWGAELPAQVWIHSANATSRRTRRLLHESRLPHSGDNTVTYASLSAAKMWLDDYTGLLAVHGVAPPSSATASLWDTLRSRWDTASHGGGDERARATVRHERVIREAHVAPKQHRKQPTVEVFSSTLSGGLGSTAVMEFDRVDHLEITRNRFVHATVFSHLLGLMGADLCIAAQGPCLPYYERPEPVEGQNAAPGLRVDGDDLPLAPPSRWGTDWELFHRLWDAGQRLQQHAKAALRNLQAEL